MKTKRISSGNAKAGFNLPAGHSGFIMGILLFIAVAFFAEYTIKPAAVVCLIVLINIAAYHFGVLRQRIYLPLLALAAYVLMDGISAFYAEFGKVALSEFLKVFAAFCTAMILLLLSPSEENEKIRGRWAGTVLAVCTALASLISIDLLSTRVISGLFSAFFGLFSGYYDVLGGVEPGVRMTSIFSYPNCFAAIVGIGVLISLGLVDTEGASGEKCSPLAAVLLFVNSLGFVLAFSMGAGAFIALAFLVFLVLQPRGRRTGLLVLMAETLLVCLPCVFLIALTSLQPWNGFQPVPILCTAFGAAGLYFLHRYVGKRLTGVLTGHPRIFGAVIAVCIAFAAVYAAFSLRITGPAVLSPGETLTRAIYAEPGLYTMRIDADTDIRVTAKSQTKEEALMRTGTTLCNSSERQVMFIVPEESVVVFFDFSSDQGGTLRSVTCENASGTVSYSVPLDYKLVPGFIARRLQGLRVNENALQRTVFFSDAMKIFRQSPLIGLGMGGFEHKIRSVQSYYYVTKYAHNHYLEALVMTGVVGLLLFLFMLGSSAVAVIRTRMSENGAISLTPALGAALFFMAGHAFIDVDFTFSAFLPVAFGVLVMINLCCGAVLPVPGPKVKKRAIIVMTVFSAVFTAFLIMNVYANNSVKDGTTLKDLDFAAGADYFEWPDYSKAYIGYATENYGELSMAAQSEADRNGGRSSDTLSASDRNTILSMEVLRVADRHAARLSQKNLYASFDVAGYHFAAGRTKEAFRMLCRFLDYVRSEDHSWDLAFSLLRDYQSEDPEYIEGVRTVIRKLDEWNEINWGTTQLSEESREFVRRYR